jgi:hypothetical protein
VLCLSLPLCLPLLPGLPWVLPLPLPVPLEPAASALAREGIAVAAELAASEWMSISCWKRVLVDVPIASAAYSRRPISSAKLVCRSAANRLMKLWSRRMMPLERPISGLGKRRPGMDSR